MGAANTHLTHLEELVLTQGPKGYDMARAFLLELLETLKGNSKSRVQTSVKWDGAPAMFAGINPENGKFFVGTKSIFNKVPKINYTEEDILKNHGHAPGLVDKLTKGLKYLPSLGIKKILQGDFMFDDEMLDVIDIEGEPHYRFKPNTIVYAVPVNSDLGKQIGQSKFGIVFHTTYDSLNDGASFGADISGLKEVPGIWFDDAFFTDDTGTVTLTDSEEKTIIKLVGEADSVNEKIDYNDIPSALLNIYINSEIKAGQFLKNPEKSFSGFISWYSQRADKKVSKLKTDRGRQRATQAANEALQSINTKKEDILNLFRVSRLLFEAKNIFIEKYNNAVYNTKHFVDDGSGDLVATNPEGYVAVDHAGNGIKFVDRLEFSRANFAIDKSDKFQGDPDMSEILTKEFSVIVSKDLKLTKTISEWLKEARKNNHTFEKLPNMVYNDIISGTPIVDIVVQENAEKTIYNAAMGFASSMLNEDEEDFVGIPLEPVEEQEDELADPVVDADFTGETVAFVPGAYKPPHLGHLKMVEQYANRDDVDRVIILISSPKKKNRTLDDGTVIKATHAEDVWKLLLTSAGLSDNPKIDLRISKEPSPIGATLDMIGENGILKPGDKIILGASDKPDDSDVPDWHRWLFVQPKDVKSGVEVLDLESNAVRAFDRQGGTPFRARDMRSLISKAKTDVDAIEELEEFVGEDNVFELLAIFGMGPRQEEVDAELEEHAIQGAAAVKTNFTNLDVEEFNDEQTRNSRLNTENIDLSMVDEVMKLIIDKGILR
jgi:hypothetical protein